LILERERQDDAKVLRIHGKACSDGRVEKLS
jgi:hypothetical protein